MSAVKQTSTNSKGIVPLGKQRSYSEVVEFLNHHWKVSTPETSVERMKKIDALFGAPSQKISAIVIEGTNGKSLTAHFASKLFKEEGFTVGTYYTPHILTYNERFSVNNELIANKTFTELANEVINTLESHEIKANSKEILTQIAFNYFVANNIDIAIFEATKGGISDPVSICKPSIIAVTRITAHDVTTEGDAPEETLKEYLGNVAKGTHVLSADQNKSTLKRMEEMVAAAGGHWGMPVRKLTPFSYPFEQLHGRCGALAERIVATYINSCITDDSIILQNSLVAKKEGQRGRPTLEAKRASELHPKKTLEQFWKDTYNTLSGRFQLLEKEKPTILLDNASNIDAINNLLLGIRLLHYCKTLKGLTIILAFENNIINQEEFLKAIRYFFKKTSGNIIVCPSPEGSSWDAEAIAEEMKALKIKARATRDFKEAFDIAKKNINERYGLIAIAGSAALVREYWNLKGIKKF